MREIRTLERNWPVLAALQAEEFVRRPSPQAFTECRKAGKKTDAWSQVRASLLRYLETGEPPWKQKDWPLPESGLDRPEADRRFQFPLLGNLINIAILEKKPEQVLKWYDQRPLGGFGWLGAGEDVIATAVQDYAPERAVSIWKNQAEQLINQVSAGAYQEAAKYLRKAEAVMAKQNEQAEWDQYLKSLRIARARKRRLLEILDPLDGKPIMKKR